MMLDIKQFIKVWCAPKRVNPATFLVVSEMQPITIWKNGIQTSLNSYIGWTLIESETFF